MTLVPSAEQATALHEKFVGALAAVQVTPEFVEVNIGTGIPNPYEATATSLTPSAEEAIPSHGLLGALLGVQVVPESLER